MDDVSVAQVLAEQVRVPLVVERRVRAAGARGVDHALRPA
jgi:hypothetical protein